MSIRCNAVYNGKTWRDAAFERRIPVNQYDGFRAGWNGFAFEPPQDRNASLKYEDGYALGDETSDDEYWQSVPDEWE
jgi:hypothetical protein